MNKKLSAAVGGAAWARLRNSWLGAGAGGCFGLIGLRTAARLAASSPPGAARSDVAGGTATPGSSAWLFGRIDRTVMIGSLRN